MNYSHQKEKLAKIASQLAVKHRHKLDQLKQEHKQLVRPDFIWYYLLQSFSTMGRAAGWHGLIGNKENYSKVTFEALESLNSTERENVVRTTCRAANIRMPDRKAKFILGCFQHIQELGGVKTANERLHASRGREEKIKFLMDFPGIGPKYARNIMMDVYHEDFRDSIAIDIRIKSISSALGTSFSSYSEHEKFYLDSAKLAGLDGWELDRLLFNFKNEFANEIALGG